MPHDRQSSNTLGAMKTFTKELWMEVPKRQAIVSIHAEVERLVKESGIREGLALVNAKRIGLPLNQPL